MKDMHGSQVHDEEETRAQSKGKQIAIMCVHLLIVNEL